MRFLAKDTHPRCLKPAEDLAGDVFRDLACNLSDGEGQRQVDRHGITHFPAILTVQTRI